MMRTTPETLAVRAVNEWRRYDVVAHLGLRLYLDARCSVRDRWATDVAVRQVRGEKLPFYYKTFHFKERDEHGGFEYREIHIPPPNEIMAETALVQACSQAGRGMLSADCVYSYRLPYAGDRRGVFVPYFEGFRQRHAAIAAACEQDPDAVVVYTDIRKFYPSLTSRVAMDAWDTCAREAGLAEWAYELGYGLIEKHAAAGAAGNEELLTGPAFTSLLANLVLSPIDRVMQELLPGGYFRYVDDFAFVGKADRVAKAESVLSDELGKISLKVHPNKRFIIPAGDWLKGKHDFSGEDGAPVAWKLFVGSVRQLLLRNPECMVELHVRFREAGVRIVPMDYSSVVQERSYVWRMLHLWSLRPWRQMVRRLNIPSVVEMGLELRKRYRDEYEHAIEDANDLSGYDRKRRIHMLRHCAGRLIYLEEESRLCDMARELGGVKEMELYAAVVDALARRDVSRLVEYGVNAAQAAAQPLKALEAPLRCCRQQWSEAALQGRAVLLAYGLSLAEDGSAPIPPHPMTAFCAWAEEAQRLPSPNSFFGRLACLHGRDDQRRHAEILGSAFDVNDNLLFELDFLMQQSS